MKLAIMQPYIFPYIGYFQLINAVDKFVIRDDVNFIMRGWINRNRILVNDSDSLFSIPVEKASQNTLTSDCVLADLRVTGKLLKSIEHYYKKATTFKYCIEVLFSVLTAIETNL